jgi:hypothetical protein
MWYAPKGRARPIWEFLLPLRATHLITPELLLYVTHSISPAASRTLEYAVLSVMALREAVDNPALDLLRIGWEQLSLDMHVSMP